MTISAIMNGNSKFRYFNKICTLMKRQEMFIFQWERDSSRSYNYTPSLIRTLYGKTYSKLTIETLDRGVKYV